MTMKPETDDHGRRQAIAQAASIAEMVAATRVDYGRLAELREKRDAGCYSVGYNMPGYMPDSESFRVDTCGDARAALADEMRRHADDEPTYAETVTDLESVADYLENEIGYPGDDFEHTIGRYHYWITHMPGGLADDGEAEELAELEEMAGGCESEDDAWQRIDDDPLSIEYRSGWANDPEYFEPEEFRIVLCTGGPHVEIQGDIGQSGGPERPRILYRDWNESGELFDFDVDSVLAYCERFIYQ